MTIKSILFAVAAAALIGAAVASCPNACSGHGSCGNHDRCKCYATYIGGDCSGRTCPYGTNGNECSGRGTCDRGAGVCECADGYGGASCQRLKCPNDCSGSGSCDTTTGLCSCAGGYSGNDCSARLCPKGDDPLTNEVENSGDGSAMQTSEVQTVTFNAGRGLGGTATLTYHDLYGQAWTTRPFSVGGDNVYRLEISVKPTSTQGETGKRKITFSYNGLSADVLVLAHGTAFAYDASGIVEAEDIRAALTPLFATRGFRHVEDDRANSVHVYKHNSATSAKLGGAIEANARLTFDIVLPIDMSNHDDNGGLASAFTASWKVAPTVNEQVVNLYSLGDRSAEIESALTSLPNNVIPSVTVAKVGVSDASTNSAGSWGNAYAQSYTISFNDAANSGDQNMLGCNAEPCDEDGCMNRGTGVSEVRYMHHDPESYGQGINFVSQGYFIMDVGSDTENTDLSAGSIKIMWDTGAGIESAIFALVATDAEVQTALRTITGWESVTVELVGTIHASNTYTANHQFKVTLPAGYDDKGKSPTFYTMKNTDGAYATAVPGTARARLFDQRFSNSIWLGKTTGYEQCLYATSGTACTFQYTHGVGTAVTGLDLMPENGDVWVTSIAAFGTGKGAAQPTHSATTTERTHFSESASAAALVPTVVTGLTDAKIAYAYLKEGATSVQTSDYFAVGATVEVLPTTWADGAEGTDVLTNVLSKNTYRKFKITGHVTNEFNREFAKLDSFPADDGVARAAADNTGIPKYNVKITSNNGTVHQYANAGVTVHVNEVQILTIGNGRTAKTNAHVFKLSYKGEESKNMDGASSPAQIAEEINSFSALSGPVSVAVTANVNQYVITFDAKDGDVAQLVAHKQSGALGVYVSTQKNGWSIEGPPSLGLDTMQAGGTINITAAEECTFDFSAAYGNNDYFFCYHGVCSHHTFGKTNDHNMADFAAQSSIAHIRDDNGHALIDNTTLTVTTPTEEQVKVTLPSGMSCDPLEIRGSPTTGTTSVTITKTVDKHNNGKQFKITRSFMQSYKVPASPTLAAQLLTCGTGEQSSSEGCHAALANVDAVVFSSTTATQCGAKIVGTDADAKIFYRTVSSVTAAESSTPEDTKLAWVANTATTTTNCAYHVARHVITLDAMPTASAHGTPKTLNYVSPIGSCSVSETTKGSQESYECSNRGACDAKSGVCSCYEGYSGQSCQTQTVLV